MKYKDNPVGRFTDIVIQPLDGELLIYDLEINKAYCLNKTSALIWQACNGENSVNGISRIVSKNLGQQVNVNLIQLALDEFRKNNLLTNSEEANFALDKMSRRQLIRNVALNTAIVLPTISSLIAPTAAMAGSVAACGAINTACSVAIDCCSNYCDDCFTGTCQPAPGGLGGCL